MQSQKAYVESPLIIFTTGGKDNVIGVGLAFVFSLFSYCGCE